MNKIPKTIDKNIISIFLHLLVRQHVIMQLRFASNNYRYLLHQVRGLIGVIFP